MTRRVQITLTLDVDVDCQFANGNWQVRRIEDVFIENISVPEKDFNRDLLLYNPSIVDQLADGYAQQEP